MFRRFSSLLGLFLGVIITLPILLGGSAVLLRNLSSAANAADGLCFVPIECIQDAADLSACKTKGCANATRIFEPDKAACGEGNGRCYAKSQPIDLIINIGGKDRVVDLGDYFATIYTYAVGIAGVLATVLMMVGGFTYLTGDPGAGMKQIKNALAGMGLTFAAYLILQTVNPDLVILRLPKIQVIKRNDFALCEHTDKAVACGKPYGIIRDIIVDNDGNINSGGPPTVEQLQKYPLTFISSDPSAANVVAKCTGSGCKVIKDECNHPDGCIVGGCKNDAQFKCTPTGFDVGPATIRGCTENPTGTCYACAAVGSVCGPGKAPCCGSCVAQPDASQKCQAGAPGERCSTITGGCAQGSKCVKTRGWLLTAFEGATETGGILNGICFAGGVGSPCEDGTDCRDENTWCAYIHEDPTTRKIRQFRASMCVPKSSGDPEPAAGTIGSYCAEEIGGTTSAPIQCQQGNCIHLKTVTIPGTDPGDTTHTQMGVCSDGSFGSVCGKDIFNNTQSICQSGLVCVKRFTLEKTWTNFWAGIINFGVVIIPESGTCLEGKYGSPCNTDSECNTKFRCDTSLKNCIEK